MISSVPSEKDLVEVAELSREELIERILNFEGRFKLDFTIEFLEAQTTDKLRHILAAAIFAECKVEKEKVMGEIAEEIKEQAQKGVLFLELWKSIIEAHKLNQEESMNVLDMCIEECIENQQLVCVKV